MTLEDLSSLLWREHELLDLLLFKAGEKQYVLVSNQSRWLPRISREIELILEQLRALEVERAAVTEGLAEQYCLASGPSLRELADRVGPPWQELLLAHHENLLGVVTEIRTMSDLNRDLIQNGLSALTRTLLPGAGTGSGVYTADGRADGAGGGRAVTLDGAL